MNEFGGGVAILFRESLTHKRIQLERHELAKAEFLSIKFQLDKFKSFIVTCLYRPKFTVSNSDIDEMELLFSEHLEKQCNFYICGDFNIHMEDTNNTQIKKFQNLLKRLSLRELVNGPTRGKARLDLIITNDNDESITSFIHQPLQSDHEATFISRHMKIKKAKKETFSYRNFKAIDYSSLAHDVIDTFDFSDIDTLPIDEAISHFTKTHIALFDKYAQHALNRLYHPIGQNNCPNKQSSLNCSGMESINFINEIQI